MYHTYFNSTSAGLLGFSRVTQTACATDGEWCFRGVGDNDASIGCEGVVRGTTNGITLDPVVNFYAPMAVGPGTPNTLYYASDRLYRSVNKGDLMTVVSQAPIVVNVPISSIGISPQNDNIRIVGLNDGSVWTDLTGSGTFTNVTAAGFPVSGSGTRYVARTIIDPNNSNTAWVTFGGFGMPAGQHVWKTTNLSGGAGTWAAAGSGIPDVPVNALVVDPTDSNTLYAGTDIGVYVTNDGGANWLPFTTGMPVVAVFDIGIQNASRILRCATHGRGMWDRSLTNPVAVDVALVGTQIHPDRVELLWHSGLGAGTVANIYRRPVPGDWAPLGQVIADNAGGIGYDDRDVAIGHTYEYAVGILSGGAEEVAGYVWVTIPGGALSLEAISPNPTSGRDFSVAFTLASSEPATLEVVDVTGRRLMGRSVGALGPGRHQVRLDERSLDPGVYWVRLSQAGRMASTKASVVR
jgi:hypothetical protein